MLLSSSRRERCKILMESHFNTAEKYIVSMAKRPEIKVTEYDLDSVGYINTLSSPRFIKSHLPFTLLPEELQQNKTAAKVVYVARNSRDTCVSYYHFCKRLKFEKLNFETCCELFLRGALPYGPFWEHVTGYWEQKDNPYILFLTYEEMKKDLRQIIYKTAKFLGKTLHEKQVSKLMDHLSFENMKNNRAVNNETESNLVQEYNLIKKFDNNTTFIRSGKVGEWKEAMTPDIVKRFEIWDQDHLKNISNYPTTS